MMYGKGNIKAATHSVHQHHKQASGAARRWNKQQKALSARKIIRQQTEAFRLLSLALS